MPQKRRKVSRRQRSQKVQVSPQQVLFRALSHPVRVQALTILSERIASPKEISDLLEMPLSNVSYHVRVLDELGLIEIMEEENVRGSVAHFYKAVERSLIDNPQWKALDPKVRKAVSAHTIETVVADAARSLTSGLFDQRPDRLVSRAALLLDEKGWRKVIEIQSKALDKIFEEQVAAAGRLEKSRAKRIAVIVGMLCFEAPAEGDTDFK